MWPRLLRQAYSVSRLNELCDSSCLAPLSDQREPSGRDIVVSPTYQLLQSFRRQRIVPRWAATRIPGWFADLVGYSDERPAASQDRRPSIGS